MIQPPIIVTLESLQKSPRSTAIEKDNRLGFITFIPFVYKSTEEIGIFISIIFILSDLLRLVSGHLRTAVVKLVCSPTQFRLTIVDFFREFHKHPQNACI